MKTRRNELDETRRDLAVECAREALAVATLERRLADAKEMVTLLGYDLVSAKAKLREATQRIEDHDARRGTMEG